MIQMIVNRDRSLGELVPILVGYEACRPSHRFGPYVREHYLIHFCLRGRGVLEDKYARHEIGAGEMFIIRPGEVTVYSADDADPWEYVWISFIGSRAPLFSTEESVYATPAGVAERLLSGVERRVQAPDLYLSILHELIHAHFRDVREQEDIASSIKRYVRHNYMEDISVSRLAEIYSFERSYLYRLFKKRYGIGLKEYITSVRMDKAKQLLEGGAKVREVAGMVGYPDEFNFSRNFKKHTGVSPSDWRYKRN